MLSFRLASVSLLLILGIGGCSSSSDTTSNEVVSSSSSSSEITKKSIEKDEEVIEVEGELVDQLIPLAQSLPEDEFNDQAIELIIPSLVGSYVPDALVDEVLSQDALQSENIKSNTVFMQKLHEFYVAANEETQTRALSDLSSIVSDISTMVYDFIYDYFFGGSEESSYLDDAIDWIWGDDNEPEGDVNVTDPSGNGGQLVSETLGFSYDMIKGQSYYVISSKADMEVGISADGKQGSGSMGFISMDFVNTIDNGNINIATSLMGDWILKMTYLDSDYCIAADSVDAEGTVYKSYWFLNEADRSKAKTVAQAQALCYQYGWVGGAPTGSSVDESDLVAIDEMRDGFEVKTGNSTKTIVESLINSPTNTADVEDAKFYTRSLRHGALSLYTTNDKPDTLEATEMEMISRTLMPLAGSSLLAMKDLGAAAVDSTKTFAGETQEDLNTSINQLSARMTALSSAVGLSMDATMQDNDYHGYATSSYGDKVDIWVTDMDVDICLVFFLCESSVSATVHFAVTNDGVDGNYADVQFVTRINAEKMDINAVNFSKVVSEQSVNRFAADGYELDLDYFEFSRANGGLHVKGSGAMNQITASASKTEATFDNFDVLLILTQQSYDITDYALTSANLSMDGKITTASGRKFDGSFYFDAQDSSANKISGTLVGINGEPTVEGTFKTSLTYKDINVGLNGREQVNVTSGLPYFESANGSKKVVSSFYEQFGDYKAEDFERNSYDCTATTQNSYSCSSRYGSGDYTLKFTQEGEIMTVATNHGDWYVVDIKDVDSYISSELVLLNKEDGKYTGLDQFEYAQAEVSNLRVTQHNLNDEVSIDNIGDHSYTMDMRVTQGTQSLALYLALSRDTKNDTWSYFFNDITMSNEYGELSVDELYMREKGELRFKDEIYNVLLGNVIGDLNIGVDSLLGLTWADFEMIQDVRVKSLQMLMNTNGGDEAKVYLSSDVTRQDNTIVGTLDSIYQYDETDFTLKSAFDIVINGSGESATFTPNIEANGTVKSAQTVDYTYAVETKGETKYLLLSNDTTSYQQGFVIKPSSVTSADSYGVKASMGTNLETRTINTLHVSNKNAASLGDYTKSSDAQKIIYNDDVSEYLYIH